MVERMMTPPYITTPQFIVAGVGFTAVGKKEKTNTRTRKHRATRFNHSPHLPSENRAGGSECPRRRRRSVQLIVMI
jgi:hypothetical protein